MATCWCVPVVSVGPPPTCRTRTNRTVTAATSSLSGRNFLSSGFPAAARSRRRGSGVICMAPEEEKMTRRSPLDFPIEWERPKPGRRPDIFPKFSPMKTPLPTPLPADPPEEDEEEEENKEEEEDPDKEEEENDKPESRVH